MTQLIHASHAELLRIRHAADRVSRLALGVVLAPTEDSLDHLKAAQHDLNGLISRTVRNHSRGKIARIVRGQTPQLPPQLPNRTPPHTPGGPA